MDFKKFGRNSFISATKVAEFVDMLAAGKICGTICKKCGTKFFPPRADCSVCLSQDMNWFDMPQNGLLETFTTAYYAPAGFEGDPPYMMGVVKFSNGLKLFARLEKALKPEDVTVGMNVGVRAMKYDDGQLSFEIVKI